jgi:hypothetical protein
MIMLDVGRMCLVVPDLSTADVTLLITLLGLNHFSGLPVNNNLPQLCINSNNKPFTVIYSQAHSSNPILKGNLAEVLRVITDSTFTARMRNKGLYSASAILEEYLT